MFIGESAPDRKKGGREQLEGRAAERGGPTMCRACSIMKRALRHFNEVQLLRARSGLVSTFLFGRDPLLLRGKTAVK